MADPTQVSAPQVVPEVCPVHGVEHQPRERAVPCSECGRATFDVHALCEGHLHLLKFEVSTT